MLAPLPEDWVSALAYLSIHPQYQSMCDVSLGEYIDGGKFIFKVTETGPNETKGVGWKE